MARKRALLLDRLQSVLSRVTPGWQELWHCLRGRRLKARWPHRWGWVGLTLGTALLCLMAAPAIAHLTTEVPRPIGISTLEQGQTLYEAGRYSEALDLLQQVMQAARSSGDRPQQAAALSNMSLVYQRLGRWLEAEQTIGQALELLQSAMPDQRPLLAQALDIQGRLQLSQGQAEKALQTWQQSEAIYQTKNQPGDLLQNRINQARALQTLGFYRRACNSLLQILSGQNYTCEQMSRSPELQSILPSLKSVPQTATTATGLRSLGDLLQLVGYSEAAQEVLQVSLTVATAVNSEPNIQAAYLSLGNIRRIQEKLMNLPQDAESLVWQELITPEDRIKSFQATLQQILLETQAALAAYQTAADGNSSLKLPSQLNQISLLVDTSRIFLRCWQTLNLRSAQTTSFQPLLKALQEAGGSLRTKAQLLLPEAQAQLATAPPSRTTIYAYINLTRSLLKYESLRLRQPSLSTQFPELVPLARIASLLSTATQQAVSLKDSRAETFAVGYLGEVYEQTGQWAEAQTLTQRAILLAQTSPDIVYRWHWQMGRILAKQSHHQTSDPSTYQAAIAAYQAAIKSLQSLRSDLVAVNPDIQFNFRDSVEPVYREAVELLLKQNSDQFNREKQLDQGSDEKQLENARKLIESLQLAELDDFFRDACIAGQNVILDQVVQQNNTRAAIIYPILLDNQLKVIVKTPNQALKLTSSRGDSQTNIEEVILQMRQLITQPGRRQEIQALSRQLYDWIIRPIEADIQDVDTLVFVPDGPLRNIPMAALFDGQRYLIEKYAVSTSAGLQLIDPKPIARQSLKALAAGLSTPPQGFEEFSPLPGIVGELKSIADVGVTTTELVDQQFTSPALQTQINATPYNVVHLATHGKFSSRREDTFILAADGKINVSQFDRLLRNRNFLRSEPVELLVLSACQTAEGDNRATLGLAGAALKAGARSTVASLWQVDDEATAFLVRRFYQALMNPQVTKAEALRQAQLAVLRDRPDPLHWAAFVLVGNWL